MMKHKKCSHVSDNSRDRSESDHIKMIDMEFTRTSPIQFNIKPISGSILTLKFVVKGSRDIIKIDIRIIIHFKNPIHNNMTDTISSDVLGVSTFIEDKAYKVLIKIPEFKNYTQSYIVFTVDPNESLYKKAFIEDINIELSSQKIDGPIIEEIPLPNGCVISHKINETIDQMIHQYNRELPKDPERRISYIYTLHSNDSFHIVASNHIKYLRYRYIDENENIEVEEIDWSQLGSINWNEKRNVLIHPFLYPFASSESFVKNSRNFARLLGMKNKIGGFDVADSNRISKLAVDLVNKIDLMMVPSSFARDAYINSGVTIPVEILPHGIPDEFLRDDVNIDNININSNINSDIAELRKAKRYGNILILYFLMHSEHRKGADVVRNVMKRIQSKFQNTYLVVKGPNHNYFSGIRTIYIGSWLNNNELRILYDLSDVCIVPSRGGGYEINGLEAISRGVPTLVTKGGCFLDLINYFIPVDLSDKVSQSLPGNPVHIGHGCEVDLVDFEKKLEDAIIRLPEWKKIFAGRSKEIRKKYTWRETAKMLETYLKKYEFVK